MTVTDLLQSLILACGGSFNSAYFDFLEMEISDCLYHLYLWINLKNKQESSPDNKLNQWGMVGVDFE